MGEAKRRQRLREREWVSLFGDGSPVAACISRPEYRPETLPHHIAQQYAKHIAERAQTARSALCFNKECDRPLLSLPDAFVVVRTSADPDAMPTLMGICPECAKKSNDEVLAVVRADLQEQGLGPEVSAADALAGMKTSGHKAVQIPFASYQGAEPLPGIKIEIASKDDCADTLCQLLKERKLGRFETFRRGHNNCHRIVQQLYLDFRDLGITDKFEYKIGSSAVLAGPADPEGWHSWLEADGWAIDASQGAFGNPILIDRIGPFYERLKLTRVRDLGAELEDALTGAAAQ